MAAQTPTADTSLEGGDPARTWPEDVATAQRCVAGEAAAIESVYREHAASVRAMARLHASDGGAVDDLVHDTFVRALELMPRYRGDAPLGVWLRGIAFNLTRTQRHRSARRRRLLRQHAEAPKQPAAPDDRTALQTLDALLRRLPDSEREAFCLRSVQRLGLTEVSSLLGIAVSTVSDRDRRAKDKLRAWMEEE
jgi:RNA polymerase sigma-70 factor (ECF subfamily)